MIPFVMSGAAGRMGQVIISLSQDPGCSLASILELSGALENENSPLLGQDMGAIIGGPNLGITLTSDPVRALQGARVVIDFSAPLATLGLVKLCAERGIAIAIGTTGIGPQEREEILNYRDRIPILLAPNMSVGINLLFDLVARAARALGSAYDIEIIETHHKHKKDAPSGTAVRFKEVLLETLNQTESDVVYGREGKEALRRPGEIGVHTVRGGDIAGDHSILFLTDGERIELNHRATSRNTFALGALRAAAFLAGAGPGEYTMPDVLEQIA